MISDVGRLSMGGLLAPMATLVVMLVVAPSSVLAENQPFVDARFEATLDLDGDGVSDRAVTVENPDSGQADLYIYLAVGDGEPDLSRPPALLKKNIAAAPMLSLEGDGKGGLIVTSGCGGCSNDYETTLTILYRGGEFVVGRYSYAWDTRHGIGSCDIDFLTGQGTVTEGLDGDARPLEGQFAPVKLSDWSDDMRPEACNP
jgi:hypothetical protein